MDLKKILEEKGNGIERGLFVMIFLSVLLSLLLQEYYPTLSIITIVLQIALITFYFLQLENRLYGLLWAGFLLKVGSYFFIGEANDYLIYLLNVAPDFAFGCVVLIKCIRVSIQNKNFELLSFILGFLLVFQAFLPLPFLKLPEEIFTFYTFALSFAIGTIIYNDNLWYKYSQDEKNIMKYILIVALSIVIQSSAKFI
jgi:hypothetical protein